MVGAIITMASVMCDGAGVVIRKSITKDITWSAVPLPCLCFLVQSVHPPNSLSEHPSTIHPTILPSIRLNHHSSLQESILGLPGFSLGLAWATNDLAWLSLGLDQAFLGLAWATQCLTWGHPEADLGLQETD